MVSNVTIARSNFAIKNIAEIPATTETQCMSTTYFADVYNTDINPFTAQSNYHSKAKRIIGWVNNSTATIMILLNHDRDNIIIIPPQSEKLIGADEKIAYISFSIKTDGNAISAGDLYIYGRVLV